MGLLGYLFGRTPKASDQVPDFEITIGTIGVVELTITLPDEDIEPDASMAAERGPMDAPTIPVEPVFCAIDYIDAAGHPSRRRITTRGARLIGGNWSITATCHERKAMRLFRLDRIGRVVTFDGEVFDATRFATDILGIDLGAIPPGDRPAPTARHHGRADKTPANFRTYTKPNVLILTGLAISDNYLHPDEAETILRYIEDEAFALEKAGVIDAIPEIGQFDMIARRLPRIRPTREDLAEAFSDLRGRPRDEIDRLKQTIAKVAVADGVVRLAEEQFIAELDEFLARTDTTAWAELDRLVAAS